MKNLVMTMVLSTTLMVYAQTEEWIQIGNANSATNHDYQVLKFDQNGNCYYAYSNNNSPSTALNVMKFDGVSWTTIGSDLTSGAFVREKDITFNNNGEPYVLFRNGTSDLTVVKFNGTSWDTVGVANFGVAGMNYKPKIEFNTVTEELVVAYRDLNSNKLSVQYFDGLNWAYFNGGQDISEGGAKFVDLVVDEFGVTYAGFANEDEGDYLSIYYTYVGAGGWFVYNNDTVVSSNPILSLDMSTGGAYAVAGYIASDNMVYAHRLSGAPEWHPFSGGSVGTADFYRDIAIGRNDAKTYIGFADTDVFYEPTTKRITDQNFLSGGLDNVDEAGFDVSTPYNIVFGNDQNDSIYVAFGSLDIKVFKLRAVSQAGVSDISKNQLEIYPNPSSDQFTIKGKGIDNGSKLQILALDGKVVYHTIISDKNQKIDISNLASGTYIVKISSPFHQLSKKIIVN